MRIERYSTRQKNRSGCGCLLLLVGISTIITIIMIVLLPAIPAIGLRLAGFQPIDQPLTQATAESIPVINSAQNASQVIISAGSYGQRTISASSAYTMQIGTDAAGAAIAQVTLTESGLATLCNQYTDGCTNSGSAFRNASVNLQNGWAIISGDAFIGSLNTWQSLSVIVSVNTNNTVNVDGVEIGGTVFAIPDGELGQRIGDIQSTANQALQQLSVQSNGQTYRLSDIIITETQLVATFR